MNNNPVPQNLNISELVKRGEDIYQQDLKQTLEPEHIGKYVAFVRRIGEVEKIFYLTGVLLKVDDPEVSGGGRTATTKLGQNGGNWPSSSRM